jgi:hypothetical protein
MPSVQRFAKSLTNDRLEEVLGGGRWATESLATAIPIEGVQAAVSSVPAEATKSAIDGALVEPLHSALGDLTRREAADPRVWQWLCVAQFPDLVWRRWAGQSPQPGMLHEALTSAMCPRFLCRASLNGISRNTLSRLWWTAEQLGDYDLARQALSNQDMFQNIFERFFGMYPPAAKACLDRFGGRSEAEIRTASKWLQQCASTTALETLDQGDVAAILDEALAA